MSPGVVVVVPLAPVLLADVVVVNDDEGEGSYGGSKGIKASGAINGYPKFDVGCRKSKAC